MFCGSCGKQIPDGSGFCPSCGAAAGGGAPRPAATGAPAAGPSAAAAQRAKLEAQFKAGSADAVAAIKILLTDPVGGLAKSYALFDQGRALMVGAIFAGAFAVVVMLCALGMGGLAALGPLSGGGAEAAAAMAVAKLSSALGGLGNVGGPSTASLMLRFLVLGAVFAAALIGACVLVRIIFKGTSQFAGEIYLAGVSLLPMTIATLLGILLGAVSLYGIISFVSIFALVWMILMLNSGCLKILGISEAKAAFAVPCIFVICTLAVRLVSGAF